MAENSYIFLMNMRATAASSLPNLAHHSATETPRSTEGVKLRRQHMNLSGPSPTNLQHHLYTSFMEARTADVSLRILGSWEAVYRLHRVVLIQSGFFNSLFTAGFVESVPKLSNVRLGQDAIDIVFDDRNITRAAFEVCIARLYGGGPTLHVSPSLIPTPCHPLTPSFPTPAARTEVPAGQHPASPRFLLSLLATAVYLSIPNTASQALNSILGSVGPHTVILYLNFALGKPIWCPQEDGTNAAVGLEALAETVAEKEPSVVEGDTSEKSFANSNPVDHSESFSPSDCISLCSEDSHDENVEPSFHYGAISNKIGEAAACWLTRWGPDILAYENKTLAPQKLRHRAATAPSRPGTSAHAMPTPTVPVIWARGGLSAKWVAAVVSSNTLFVRGERERYDFARSVVELRRAGGIIDSEEQVWTKMFAQGIYYSNMLMEDLIAISRDVSPTTGRPFVPLTILQAAHWSQTVLQNHITTTKPSIPASATSSPTPQDRELGIWTTTADILAASTGDKPNHEQQEIDIYYPIPADSSSRLGGNDGTEATTMDQLFEAASTPSDSKTLPRVATSEDNFFGLMPERHTASSSIVADLTGKARWSPYPPFRFAVEFWDVGSLKEKSRLHSHTIWHAGSLFNVYVQVVRKKGVQLGVYIHRQSSVDPIPMSSSPSPLISCTEYPQGRGPSDAPIYSSPSPASRSTTPSSRPTTSLSGTPTSATIASNTIPATAAPVTPPQPYRDPRASISAYFSISCASATGSSLTRFTSAPDVFSVSQSWGWKSSSLRTEEYIEVEGEDQFGGPLSSGAGGKEVSLRATVVLGVV